MSSNVSDISDRAPIQMVYRTVLLSSTSEDVPKEDWSSLFTIPESDKDKVKLFKQGLYEPGSGEICTKYIGMSDSSVMRHVHYNYPTIKDPGVMEALQNPEDKKIYSLDGQELYMDLCKEMGIIPIRSFHRGLLQDEIDLKYYGVNPAGLRPMSMALLYNRYVTRLDLTSNFLDNNACYDLGQMLRENITIQELVLCGCRVGPEGIRRLVAFLSSRSLNLLDLSRNELGDEGLEHLANQISRGAIIKRLNLSYNDLGPESMLEFASAIKTNNSIACLDLSWNKLKVVGELVAQLADSSVLEELNLSWNALKGSNILRKLFAVPTLRILDLSNNKLSKFAVSALAKGLLDAQNFYILDVSNNPLTAADAFKLVSMLRVKTVKLTNLLMDNVAVDRKFAEECREVLALSYRRECKVTYGDIIHNYDVTECDFREIVFRRLDFLTRTKKHGHLNIALYFLKKKKEMDFIQPRQIMRDFRNAGVAPNEELITSLTDVFPGPKLEKAGKTLDLIGVVDYVSRLWPDQKVPLTPPPAPESAVSQKKKKTKQRK